MSEFKKWQPNDKQREILLALQAESEKFDPPLTKPNVTAFCKEYATFTDSKFSKIMDVLDPKRERSYFDDVKKPEALMVELAEWLEKIPAMRLAREKQAGLKLYKLSKFRAVAVSVRECKNEVSPERITKYISPTGGGKTFLRRYLENDFKGEISFHAVESRETWRPASRDQRQRSKTTVLRDFCAGFGMRNVDWTKGISGVEDQIITFCTTTTRILFIDEAEFFSAYVLNLIKLLTNKSRLIILIACTPRAHAKWNSWYPDEADQISRRTRAVIAVSFDDLNEDNLETTTKDLRQFFPDDQFENPKMSLEYIAEQAWTFGHYSTVARIAKELAKHSRAEKAQVEKAVGQALKEMAKERRAR